VLTASEHATFCVSAQNNRKSDRPFWHVPDLPDGQSGPGGQYYHNTFNINCHWQISLNDPIVFTLVLIY